MSTYTQELSNGKILERERALAKNSVFVEPVNKSKYSTGWVETVRKF